MGFFPVVKLGNLTPLASDTDHQKRIEAFVRNFALVLGLQAQGASVHVPVIEPGDPRAADKLEAILKLNPVSRRLEVAEALSDDTRALGCAYVTSEEHPAATYLGDLARQRIRDLPDPTFEDTTFPLLYRLARLSLSKTTIFTAVTADFATDVTLNTRVHLTEPEERHVDLRARTIASASLASLAARRPVGIGATAADAVQFASQGFLEGLQRLEAIASEPDGVAKLRDVADGDDRFVPAPD